MRLGRTHGTTDVAKRSLEHGLASRRYEHVFIARQTLAAAQVDALAEHASQIIEDHGGQVVRAEFWGLRRLMRRSARNRTGHYVMLDFEAPAPAVEELERQSQINEDVIRYMTVQVSMHADPPKEGRRLILRRVYSKKALEEGHIEEDELPRESLLLSKITEYDHQDGAESKTDKFMAGGLAGAAVGAVLGFMGLPLAGSVVGSAVGAVLGANAFLFMLWPERPQPSR